MNTVTKLLSTVALAALVSAALPPVSRAQEGGPPGAPIVATAPVQYAPVPAQQFPGNPYGQNGNPYGPYQGGGRGYGRRGQYQNGQYGNGQYGNNGGNNQVTLPEGVNSVIASEGTNTIIAIATEDGYDRLRDLIKNLDGDLDVIRTEVKQIPAGADDLKTLGLTTTIGTPLSDADSAKVLAAVKAGQLRTSDTVRMTTRENTPIDTLLKNRSGVGTNTAPTNTPLTLIPREQKDGSLALEVVQPFRTLQSVGTNGTLIVPIAGQTSDSVTLLQLTPSIVPSDNRPIR